MIGVFLVGAGLFLATKRNSNVIMTRTKYIAIHASSLGSEVGGRNAVHTSRMMNESEGPEPNGHSDCDSIVLVGNTSDPPASATTPSVEHRHTSRVVHPAEGSGRTHQQRVIQRKHARRGQEWCRVCDENARVVLSVPTMQ